jgi:hypothetical protein
MRGNHEPGALLLMLVQDFRRSSTEQVWADLRGRNRVAAYRAGSGIGCRATAQRGLVDAERSDGLGRPKVTLRSIDLAFR